jgi:tetratricopeptide (TPR) repeat protein
MDEVLFRLTELLASIGKREQANEFYSRLSRDYPQSKYVPAATIVVADAICRDGQSEMADGHPHHVATLRDPALQAYAEYSRAWCELDLGHGDRALEGFVAAVRMSRDGGDARLQRLRANAITDLVRAYARFGSPERAPDFFRRVDAEAAREMMRSLVDAYRSERKPSEADRAAVLVR